MRRVFFRFRAGPKGTRSEGPHRVQHRVFPAAMNASDLVLCVLVSTWFVLADIRLSGSDSERVLFRQPSERCLDLSSGGAA